MIERSREGGGGGGGENERMSGLTAEDHRQEQKLSSGSGDLALRSMKVVYHANCCLGSHSSEAV